MSVELDRPMPQVDARGILTGLEASRELQEETLHSLQQRSSKQNTATLTDAFSGGGSLAARRETLLGVRPRVATMQKSSTFR